MNTLKSADSAITRYVHNGKKPRCRWQCKECKTTFDGAALQTENVAQWTIVYCDNDQCCRETVHFRIV